MYKLLYLLPVFLFACANADWSTAHTHRPCMDGWQCVDSWCVGKDISTSDIRDVPKDRTIDADVITFGSVQVSVYGPPDGKTTLSGARMMQVSISGPGVTPQTKTSQFLTNSRIPIAIPDISFGSNRQIKVLLCKTACDPAVKGDIIAKGYSIPFSVQPGDNALHLFVYTTLIDDFSPTAVSYSYAGGVKQSYPTANSLMGSRSVVLQDGRILMTGGATVTGTTYADALSPRNITQVFNTAVIYDPNSNVFSTIQPGMLTPRAYHTMTVVPDGRVLICGGFTRANNVTAATNLCEVFHPDTNTFDRPKTKEPNGNIIQPHMAWARAMHTATLVDKKGDVLLAGGLTGAKGPGLNTWEVYSLDAGGDIAYGTKLSVARWNHTAVLLDNYAKDLGTPLRVLLLIGGENTSNVLNTVDVIDLDCNMNGTYAEKADKTGKCVNPGVGGAVASAGPLTLPGPGRTLHSTIYEPSRQIIYVIGGFTKKDYSAATNRVDIFFETKGNFAANINPRNFLVLSHPRAASAVALRYMNGLNTILIAGGVLFPDASGPPAPTNTAEVILETLSGSGIQPKVVPTGANMGTAMAGNQAIMLNTRRVLVLGGLSGNLAPNTDAYLYTFQ